MCPSNSKQCPANGTTCEWALFFFLWIIKHVTRVRRRTAGGPGLDGGNVDRSDNGPPESAGVRGRKPAFPGPPAGPLPPHADRAVEGGVTADRRGPWPRSWPERDGWHTGQCHTPTGQCHARACQRVNLTRGCGRVNVTEACARGWWRATALALGDTKKKEKADILLLETEREQKTYAGAAGSMSPRRLLWET